MTTLFELLEECKNGSPLPPIGNWGRLPWNGQVSCVGLNGKVSLTRIAPIVPPIRWRSTMTEPSQDNSATANNEDQGEQKQISIHVKIAVQEQITMAIQKFLNFVEVDPDPPTLNSLVDKDDAKKIASDEDAARDAPLPVATTDDLFAIGHTKIKIRKSLFLEIIRELEMGLVPPIYHALIRGKPCFAFRRNQHIMPSGSTVVAYEFSDDASISDSIPLDDVGFKGENLNKAVNDKGIPLLSLPDGDYGTWEYDQLAAVTAENLVNQRAELIGLCLEATPLTFLFDIDKIKDNTTKFLVTRPESRGVVACCFARQDTSAIVGFPGIGKSWQLIYALQQALLYDGANVVLCAGKEETLYLFLRRGNTLYVWSKDGCKSRLFRRHDVLLLYDPPEVKSGGANFAPGSCQAIVAMSANDAHNLKAQEKQERGVGYFNLAPPTREQILRMLRNLDIQDSPLVVSSRIDAVGPLPRYIANAEIFEDRKKVMKALVDSTNIKMIEEFIKPDGWIRQQKTLSGRILAIAEYPRLEFNGVEVPNGYIDYEGLHIDYTKRNIMILSNFVLTKMVQTSRKILLSAGVTFMDINRINLGNDVEKLFIDDFKSLCIGRPDPPYQASKWKLGDAAQDTALFLIKSKCNKVDLTALTEDIESQGFRQVKDVLSQVRQIVFLPKSFPVIDAAGPGRQVFQVTIAKRHSPKIEKVRDLLLAAGILAMDKKGVLYLCHEPEPLIFYWVVHTDIFVEWGTKKPVNLNQEKSSPDNQLIQKGWDEYVRQYALEIPPNPPTLTERQPTIVDIPPSLPDIQPKNA
jgi:hypothetical protein